MSKKHKHHNDESVEKETKEQEVAENSEEDKVSEEEKVSEVEQKLEQALRAYAACENDKKIIEKQKTQAIEYAAEKFAKDLLPVADTLELAIKNIKEKDNGSVKEMLEGIELTLKKMMDTFKNYGIEPVEHKEFDPNLHQAIQQIPSEEHKNGEIVEVYQKGYKLKDRLIRPSMVTICKN